jgi:hypothetical protein
MEKLMKPAEYAKALGISRQAVYAKIKRGILKAKEVEGKLYIVVEGDDPAAVKNDAPPTSAAPSANDTNDYEALLAAKDETIAVLKETVNDLKASHQQISTTLRGEIELLKEAFHEMRTLYKMQLEHKRAEKEEAALIDIVPEEETESEAEAPCRMSVKKLFKRYGITKEKTREKIRKRIKKAWERGDTRIVFESGKFRLLCDADYDDLIKKD